MVLVVAAAQTPPVIQPPFWMSISRGHFWFGRLLQTHIDSQMYMRTSMRGSFHENTHAVLSHADWTFMSCRQWLMTREDDLLAATVWLDTYTHTQIYRSLIGSIEKLTERQEVGVGFWGAYGSCPKPTQTSFCHKFFWNERGSQAPLM